MHVLEGRVALVTGSSRGIGAAVAKLFAENGARVAVHGRDAQALASVQADIEQAGGRAHAFRADVTKFAEIELMRLEIEQRFGAVNIVVANAGGSFSRPGPIEDTDEAAWRSSID